jgi:hypothetical protein
MAEILKHRAALFPMRLGPVDLREESEDFYVGHTLDVALNARWRRHGWSCTTRATVSRRRLT